MVDALVSGASAERRVGSSPILGTRSSLNSFFYALIEVVSQLLFKKNKNFSLLIF